MTKSSLVGFRYQQLEHEGDRQPRIRVRHKRVTLTTPNEHTVIGIDSESRRRNGNR
jgi:hypothetical protein